MNLKEKARQLPSVPGVYFMKDAGNNILYVGKAKRLNQRVISYFMPSTPQSKKNQRMIFHIADFDYQIVETELEALLLEQQMITQLHPPYNRLMNYAERYRFLHFADDQLHILKEPQGQSFGPFSQYKRLPDFIRVINDLYDLPDKRWAAPAAKALHEKRQQFLPKLSPSLKQQEILATLAGGSQALAKIEYQQNRALENLAFEWAQSLENDKEVLQRFQRQAVALHKILATKPRVIFDEVNPETLKLFLVFQGKIVADTKISRLNFLSEQPQKYSDIPEFQAIKLPTKESFVPLHELDSRLIVASYFTKKRA